ncbi:nitrate ABC transporter substrate-binding protein [Bradyrhizobium nanningense]|uniref:CmpA/NrtA family ABC transporter substrate-binding protein n=1 Tax=Bradyrhizobium nanningense TaxID=1325118 RepID=UPI0010091723|nr:CmpA/NrtA family ABC transporter substrate-binding protein [Bradyrhizobium nanningense]RXH35269.1 nitrate ABC transporter substrate-binding protein [Bradyrhizobium nanningense]
MSDAFGHHGLGCKCCDHSPAQPSFEAAVSDRVEQALLHGLFPQPILRRELLRTVGAGAIIGALSSILPIETLKAIAQERKPLEKTKLAVGFLPITCAAPLIYGEKLGSYSREGLEVSLQKIAGIALIRDKMLNGELDVSQQVMPVPLTMTAGLGGNVQSIKVLTILNQNGNSLVLANKHRDNREPKNWKGFTFAVPFEQSHQTLQLRNYLAAAGLDPDQDVKYRIVPPTEYVASLRVGSIDGFFGGEPGGQRAVYEGAGFIHLISKEIWDGHPCCSVTASESWIQQNPNTFMAFYRAIIAASLHVSKPENRVGMAKVLSEPQYLNAPEIVLEQVLGGTYADGLGAIKKDARRVDYQPFPQYSAAVWLMTQLRRWNMLKEDVDYKTLAERVMLATDAARIMREQGASPPVVGFGSEKILGKDFDSGRPLEYLASVKKSG